MEDIRIDAMKKYRFSSLVTLIFMLLYGDLGLASTISKDIVLIIDNSGSMKKGDPHFLTRSAVTEFVKNLSDDTQVAVLIFDHRVNLAVPLTIVSEANKEAILASFDNIDYRGILTNLPAAMEMAIYELKTKGQESSKKSIIFITDGIVDTGNKQRDIEKTRWLRENLSEEAAVHGIKIFGIAFTNLADFELIQSLAQKTKGEYFRVLIPEEILEVFPRIHQLIVSMEPESVEPVRPPLTVEPERSILEVPSAVLSEPEIEKSPIYVTEAPKPTPIPVKSKKLNLSIIMLIALALAAFTVIAVFLLRSRWKPSIVPPMPEGRVGVTDEFLPEASLRDVSVITGEDTYKISEKITKIGRKEKINQIIINQETISRQHAIIEYKNFAYWISDQDSSNGTFLNGEKIINEMQLNNGDIISIDVYDFEFIMPGLEFAKSDVDKTVFRKLHDIED